MILSFEFQYISQNGVLENFLKSICEEFEINYKIDKNETIVTLHVEAVEEKLGEFADFLSARLPLSIFFKSSTVHVSEEIKSYIDIKDCNLTLPYTPKVLSMAHDETSIEYMSCFVKNEVGIAPFAESKKISLFDKEGNLVADASDSQSYIEIYANISQKLLSGSKVLIQSSSGDFIYTKVDASTKSISKTCKNIVATDLSVVEKMAVIRENEIKALASLEKPSIRLKVNSLFAAKEILDTNRVKIKLADDMLLQLLCEKLFIDGIEFLYRQEAKTAQYDFVVNVDGRIGHIPQIEVCVLENGEIFILSGDGYCASVVKENLKKFDDIAHAQFTSVIQEHDLFGEQSSCFYLSKTNNDKIIYVSQESGMLDLISFPIMKSIKEVFDTIKESTTGKKMLESYEKQYPEIYKKALETQIPTDAPNNIYTMWGICAVILGISDSVEEGSEQIIENAEDYGGQKGPRIDYPLITPETLISNFNFIKMIRSAMSFKVAGTDDRTLSFGFVESLAYFLSDQADYYKENLQSSRMVLCGSLFGIRRLSELACRNIKASSKLAFNRELPIDN